ncbi:MAG: InlB B-repeat-containing protein [Kiritimatiellae bacterium]|nr:InlB B-repeat-containing protein [Kiritimatiellia bacterium]
MNLLKKTLFILYTKDESQHFGADAGWLDNVRWSPRVSVLFDGQGGTVLTNLQMYYADDCYTNLPAPFLLDSLFGGWWTTPDGQGVEVYNGMLVPPANHTLYARWLSANEVLNSPVDLLWTLGGGAMWFAQTNEVKQGIASMQSGSIGNNQQTQTPVPVPFTWIDNFYPGLSDTSAYEAIASGRGINQRPVWESYVAGLNPTNPLSQFIANIRVSNDIRLILWPPDIYPDRIYTVWGKTNLADTVWGPTNADSRFFKVKVEMP